MNENKQLDKLIETIIKQKIGKLNKTILTEADEDISDLAYKMYRHITDALFITLKNPQLKKEFYKTITDLQNQIEKYLYDYEKNKDQA